MSELDPGYNMLTKILTEKLEYIKIENIKILSISKVYINSPLNKLILKRNKKLAFKIEKCMIKVFNDTKRVTLSIWSWLSREVMQMKKKIN